MLDDFQADPEICLNNEVVDTDYFVNYAPMPKPGWQFVRWDGICGHLSEGDNCRFEVTQPFVAWFDQEGVDTSSFKITAVFEPIPTVAPTADAGADQSVDEMTNVQLDGSNSSDEDGGIASYQWIQTNGASVTLNNSDTVSPDFQSPELQETELLSFQLQVTDNDGLTATDSVDISVNPVNASPVASAGEDQTVNEMSVVTLAGSGGDSDGTVSIAWSQTDGTPVDLDDATSATTSFAAPQLVAPETLIFQLTVTDNENVSATDRVSITVVPVNIPPWPKQELIRPSLNRVSLFSMAWAVQTPTGRWFPTPGPSWPDPL